MQKLNMLRGTNWIRKEIDLIKTKMKTMANETEIVATQIIVKDRNVIAMRTSSFNMVRPTSLLDVR